jgi:acyl-homoserine lactone acylase PvdQ
MKADDTSAGPAGASGGGVVIFMPNAAMVIVFVVPILMALALCAGNVIFPPGQDGNMFSFFYDNWLDPWSNGQYLPAFMSQWPTAQTLTVKPQD